MLYDTRWIGLASRFWEREADIRLFRPAILLYWTGSPKQRGSTGSRRYQYMRRSAAAIELHRDRGKGCVARGVQFLFPVSNLSVWFWIIVSFVARIFGPRVGITSGNWA